MGSVYDALLLNRDDAQARREDLALRIDRACISGRSVLCRLVALMHHRHRIPRYKRENMAIPPNMRRLSITGQLAKCVSLILVGIAMRGKG